MPVLVDSSVWISYFRNGKYSDVLDYFIDENLIVINDLILSELIPSLKIHNKLKLIRTLKEIEKLPININWEGIIKLQTKCLKNGICGIGIPDFIIAQNAIENKSQIFTNDKHFLLLQEISKLKVYPH